MANAVVCVFVFAATFFRVTGLDLPNLALNKPTEQSSLYTRENIVMTSDLAVDGKHGTDSLAGHCAHVELFYRPSLDWWQVDLQQIYMVLTLSITNRGDSCPERLTNFTVEVHIFDPMASSNSGLQLCCWHKGTVGRGSTVDLTCTVNTVGRYVRIVKYSSGDEPLTLCEVEVRGTPVHRTCGESSVEFSRQSTGAREPHYIIARHENIRKLDCAFMCLRKATCKAFNARSPSMGVVSCELLARAVDTIKNVSWDMYTIGSLQCE